MFMALYQVQCKINQFIQKKSVKNPSQLIVIDGIDGSGKATQTKLLVEHLEQTYPYLRGKIIQLEFPNYEDTSSTLVKEFLQGQFKAKKYQSSLFYTSDRIATFTRKLGNGKTLLDLYHEGGYLFICDRYTTSNFLHQSTTMRRKELKSFIRTMEFIEYDLAGLPRPDLVIYLDVEADVSYQNLLKRYNNDLSKLDDMEKFDVLSRVYYNKLRVVKQLKWKQIQCTMDGEMRSIEGIHRNIIQLVKNVIK